MRRTTIILLLLSGTPGLAQQATPAGGAGSRPPAQRQAIHLHYDGGSAAGTLRTHDEATGALLVELDQQGLELVSLDVAGRSQLDGARTDRPRWRDDVPGAARIELQGRNGTLYRYRRTTALGTLFGHLVVQPNGLVRRTLERRGIGAAQGVDPFVPTVAVSNDGGTLLLATRPQAGGDLFEVDVATGRSVNRTKGTPPQLFSKDGIFVSADWGFGVTRDGLWRFDRQPGAQAAPVPYEGATPPFVSGQAAVSRNGEWAIFTAGSAPNLLVPYVVGRFGDAVAANDTPQQLSTAGYLPDQIGGPLLAVANDGGHAAWVQQDTVGLREAWMAKVDPPVGQTPAHLTNDGDFLDTLDEVGVVDFATLSTLNIAIGGRTLDPQEFIESADIFRVSLDGTGSAVWTNITGTSGDLVPPFDFAGTITTSAMISLDGGLLYHDDTAAEIRMIRPAQTISELVMADVKAVEWIEAVGPWVFVALRRDAQPRLNQIWRLPRDLSGPFVLAHDGTEDTRFMTPASDGDTLAYVRVEADTFSFVHRMDIQTMAVETHNASLGTLRAPLGFGPGGGLLFTELPVPTTHEFFVWPRGGVPAMLAAPSDPGVFLPGE